MGCGKTLTAIAIMGALYEKHMIERVLVVAPTSVVAVWPDELSEYAGFEFTCQTMLGEKGQRLKALEFLSKYKFPKLKVACINYESLWREGIFEALQDYDADMMICDESQRIKSHDAAQSKAAHKLGDQARYKLILTGTPVQNNAIDIWSQYRFLDRTVFGDSFWGFRGRYAVMGGFQNKKVIGYKDMDELITKEHSIAYRITKEEAIDLPEQTFEIRKVRLSREELSVYEAVRKDSYAELATGGEVTANTVLVRILRLQQIAGGFVTEDSPDGPAAKPRQIGTSKLDALADIVSDYVVDAGKKLVIFARFIAEVDAIQAMVQKLLKPQRKKAVCIYGAVKKEERGGIVHQFQEDPDTVVFIGQIDTAGTGITLTAADTCVYYSKNYNYATYSQSLSRIHRIGQRNTCTYIDLVAEGTVDETITKALGQKEDIAKTIVDNWRDFF